MTHFTFLQLQWPPLFEAATKAESAVFPDPRTACFYARRALELAVAWLYKHDPALKLPYQDNLSALIHEPTFKSLTGEALFSKARIITRLGNQAAHSSKPIQQFDALTAVRELFHICYWLAHTYAVENRPEPGLIFDQNNLPTTTPLLAKSLDQLLQLEAELRTRDEKLSLLLNDKATLDVELQRLRVEVAAARRSSSAQPDSHDYSEAETRDYFIDLLLKEAGWPLDQERDREYEVAGMRASTSLSHQERSLSVAEGKGFVDYVLWGDDGIPLALVEAKRTKRDARVGQQQAKLYADCLETRFGRRPVIFYSNGYEQWLWDDTSYPPRPVQGFYKKAELELLVQRRTTRKPLATTEINGTIVERYYQQRAIRRIGESLEVDRERKALLVMATGAGKTRVVIALCELLMRCNWIKRVLFLADRIALVDQAVGVFKTHLPDAAPVNLVTDKDTEGRVYVSTYPTMMGLIDETRDGQRRFGIGHFDLVIIDEAHRSVFQKYRAIFDYFDSLLVGLTATPKDEVDRNTYSLFDLENGVPTDAYSLDEAVADKFLVPARAVSVPLKFQREGIRYDALSDEEKDQWDAMEWDEEGNTPDRVEAEAVNKWLFNTDTVDKVLKHVMTRGLKVAGGDRLGKTIIFAKNQAHAEFIYERFNLNYPHYQGEFARVITFKTEYVKSIIDKFYKKEGAPHIAISVDMLDTGIDVPEVVNLVFFKLVRSKTKFWQMLGRGTRLCFCLFGPGLDKKEFYVFDFCQNLEYFSHDPETTEGSAGASLGKRLFLARLELVAELDRRPFDSPSASLRYHAQGPNPLAERSRSQPDRVAESSTRYDAVVSSMDVRNGASSLLHAEVAAMNLDNFVIRPKRRLVEKYAVTEAWTALTDDSYIELANEVAGLPSELNPEAEETKRFDLLMLNLQLAMLRAEPAYVRLSEQLRGIAGLLEEKAAIPMVRDQLALIMDLQTDEWWQDVTVPMLEVVRKRLRSLVKLMDKKQLKTLFTDFEDEIGPENQVDLPGFTSATGDFEKFRAKVRAFLRAHEDHIAIHKLRMNRSLTKMDLEELERILLESGVGTTVDLTLAAEEAHGLGIFVRSLVGLDREAAKEALAAFLDDRTLGANQIEFVNLIVNHLTDHGVMDAGLLYESPFTDIAPQGPELLFTSRQMDQLVEILEDVTLRAAAYLQQPIFPAAVTGYLSLS